MSCEEIHTHVHFTKIATGKENRELFVMPFFILSLPSILL